MPVAARAAVSTQPHAMVSPPSQAPAKDLKHVRTGRALQPQSSRRRMPGRISFSPRSLRDWVVMHVLEISLDCSFAPLPFRLLLLGRPPSALRISDFPLSLFLAPSTHASQSE